MSKLEKRRPERWEEINLFVWKINIYVLGGKGNICEERVYFRAR